MRINEKYFILIYYNLKRNNIENRKNNTKDETKLKKKNGTHKLMPIFIFQLISNQKSKLIMN